MTIVLTSLIMVMTCLAIVMTSLVMVMVVTNLVMVSTRLVMVTSRPRSRMTRTLQLITQCASRRTYARRKVTSVVPAPTATHSVSAAQRHVPAVLE